MSIEQPADDGICEHDMEFVVDEIGDPGVINGTYAESFYRCKLCGHEESATDGGPDDDYDEGRWGFYDYDD